MKVFLVACFISITFFSQGWGGKHYLVETKDKADKYGPEAGHDYNDYGEDEDGNAVDTYEDDTYDDGTNDDDTYNDEENEEVIDVEGLMYDSAEAEAGGLKEFEDMDLGKQNDLIDELQEAAMAKEESGSGSADYSNKLASIKYMLRLAKKFLDVLLDIMRMADSQTLRKYKVKSSTYELRKDCYRKCRRKKYKDSKNISCHQKCQSRYTGRSRTVWSRAGK